MSNSETCEQDRSSFSLEELGCGSPFHRCFASPAQFLEVFSCVCMALQSMFPGVSPSRPFIPSTRCMPGTVVVAEGRTYLRTRHPVSPLLLCPHPTDAYPIPQ